MDRAHRFRIAVGLMFLGLWISPSAVAQFGAPSPPDLTGTWRWISQEDERDRAPGAYPGDYRGLPLNDAARMRADTYDEEWNSTSPLNQCRSRGPTYQPKALDDMQIDKDVDPITRRVVAYRVSYWKTPGERMIWLDGRAMSRWFRGAYPPIGLSRTRMRSACAFTWLKSERDARSASLHREVWSWTL